MPGPPTEDEFIYYFYYLRHTMNFKASTLWSTYSRINNNYQRRYGLKLQTLSRLKHLLKQFSVGYERKTAQILTLDQLCEDFRSPRHHQNGHYENAPLHLLIAVDFEATS